MIRNVVEENFDVDAIFAFYFFFSFIFFVVVFVLV